MKILFLSQEYPPETGWGGIGSFVKIIGAALAHRGHDVHVLSCVAGQPPSDLLDGSVWVHRRRAVRASMPGRSGRLSTTAQRLDAAASCKRYVPDLGGPFDVIESPDWMAEGARVARSHYKALVAHLHTPAPIISRFERSGRDYSLAGRVEKRMVNRADLITSPSYRLAEELRTLGWLDPDKRVAVVPQPVDLERWKDVAPAGDAPRTVACIGRLERRKAPEVLVRALAIVGDARCIFVGKSSGSEGGGSYVDYVQGLARELGVDCEFVGSLDRVELPGLLDGVRVVAMPSRFESFGMAGAEGMAAGRPVVTTSGCGLSEVMTPECGAVVPADDIESLARALSLYLDDAKGATTTGAEARRVIGERCAADTIAAEREALYEEATQL